MTRTIDRLKLAPNEPAVYALLGGEGSGAYVAYVGVASALRRRLEQHLERRDSSVTTGAAAVSLDPERVTEVRWWEHPRFGERAALEAAEMVAIEALAPALRSRGAPAAAARDLLADPLAAAEFAALFAAAPSGRLVLPSLAAALDRIAALERRLDLLEARLRDSGE
ncbi:MAG: hypothetical protein ACKOWF_06585 [Chloroflexota bacterium]